MERRTHTREGRSGIAALVAVLAVVVGVLTWGVASSVADASPAAPPHPYAAWSDAQLAARVQAVELQSELTGARLVDAEEARAAIDRDRSVAQELLAQWVANAYENGVSSDELVVSVLAGGDIGAIADRLHAARVVGAYHTDLVAQLDASAARLQASAVDKAALVQSLGAGQAELVRLRAEQSRRAQLVAEQQARVQEARAVAARARTQHALAAAAASATSTTGTLVDFASPVGVPAPAVASGPPTAALIDAYLASKGSPMTGQGAAFMASAARWQVDPRFVVAIAGAESNFGQQTCGPFNAWGWACPNDPADFLDWATGIETITRGLRKGYLDEGRTSVMLIQQKYAPSTAANDPTGLNLNWVGNVSKFLGELGGNPTMVGPGPAPGVGMPDLGSALLGDD